MHILYVQISIFIQNKQKQINKNWEYKLEGREILEPSQAT